MRIILIVVAALVFSGSAALAEAEDCGFGFAGVLSKKNHGEIPSLILSAGEPLLESGRIELRSGKYYELEVVADGSQELALSSSGFFRAIWIDEIVIEGIEIRPMGVSSLEFDDAGTAEISFLAIKPGTYTLGVPGSDLQKVEIVIR